MSHVACYCIKMRRENEGVSHAACYMKRKGGMGGESCACYCIKMRG